MKTKKNAVWAIWMMLTAMVMGVFTSCTDQLAETDETRQALPVDNRPVATYECNRVWCSPVDTGATHGVASSISVAQNGEVVKTYSAEAKSEFAGVLTPDTVDIYENFEVVETSHTHTKTYVDGVERDVWKYYFNDSRHVTITWSAEHPKSVEFEWIDEFNNKKVETYKHGYDSILNIKFIDALPSALTKGDAPTKYVKRIDLYTYRFEVTTAPVKGDGKLGEQHSDIIKLRGLSRVWDTNSSTPSLKGKGSKPISDTEERDSVEITLTWDDGHKEDLIFRNTRDRELKALPRRQEILSALDNETADLVFVHTLGSEEPVRSDANWSVFGRTDRFVKNCSVHGSAKEILYDGKRQRSVFRFMDLEVSFDYNDWNLTNESDNFTIATVSDMAGFDEEDYVNRIATNYNGWRSSLNEVVSWYAKAKEITEDSCVVINKRTFVDDEYIHFRGEKVIYYSDGSTKKDGNISLDVLWKASPESNWLIKTDHIGTYVSNDLSLNHVSESTKTQGSFTYNQHNYRFKNFVSGKENSGVVAIVKGCKYDDGKFKCSFDDVEFTVVKGSESTSKTSTESGIDTYTYGCEAVVRYGNGVQRVTLPGTILVDTRSHEHGKINEVLFTTTENDARNSYLSVCVIVFEDGFRSIGMAGNGETDFASTSFTMSSRKDGINSAVWNGGWIPAKAEDLPGEGNMVWFDESGKDIRSYSYVRGEKRGWNNGNNTVIDPRREGRLSEDRYSVTFYLNGQKGKTLVF